MTIPGQNDPNWKAQHEPKESINTVSDDLHETAMKYPGLVDGPVNNNNNNNNSTIMLK